jgi:hypothetical protein
MPHKDGRWGEDDGLRTEEAPEFHRGVCGRSPLSWPARELGDSSTPC